jgi:hypothetical protein
LCEIPTKSTMPRARRSPAAAASVQPQGVSKSRRLPVRWDHRKDKFLLLAIFSQMNFTAPDFKQLSDVLGSEIYSAGVLRYFPQALTRGTGIHILTPILCKLGVDSRISEI